jgi:beta-phosphoglucomutase
MFRAVIFDFDGVITDSEILHFRAFNKILVKHGIEITREDYYKKYLGLSDFDLFTLFVNNGMLSIDKDQIDDLIRQKNIIFEKIAGTEAHIIDGVSDFLEILSKNNVAIAICSGALLSEIELILRDAKLSKFFETIVSADQVSRGKPYPDGFLLTLEKLNQKCTEAITPQQCIVIEDSNWGLEAANRANMHTIAITNSYQADQLPSAEKIISHLNELTIADLQQLCA